MRKIILSLMVGATSLCLSGCTMTPDYSRPDLPIASAWPKGGEGQKSEGLTPAASIAWQEFFRSPQMREVIATALEHNRDLRIATQNVEVVRANYRIERARLLPNVSGDVDGSRQKISQNIPFSSAGNSYVSEFYTANVSASYGIDFFGRLRSLNAAAKEQFLASEEARRAVQVSLIAEVANAYLQLLADKKILLLTEQTLKAQKRSYELIEQRAAQGVANSLELSQARIPLETARVNHAVYTRLVQQDMNALILLMGKENEGLLEATDIEDITLMDALPAGLPSDVLLLRPDIRQAEHELLSANANIGAARAAFFPTIRLTGSIGESSRDLTDLFTSAAGPIWSFAPSISLPIFEGGNNFANLKASKVKREMAVSKYEKSIQEAFREVADELAAQATLGQQITAQADLVEAANQAYTLSQARYDKGIDSFLSVLDAQRSKYEAETLLIETQKQYFTNRVNLYKVLGGGQISAKQNTGQ